MYKVILLAGKAASGKDTLLQRLLEEIPSLHGIVSCTTRPPREGEVNGKNYYFLTHEEFAERVEDGRMFEATIFNNWCYGTCVDHLSEDKINIGVYNPEGIECMMGYGNVVVYPILIEASDKTRLIRQLNRETNPDVKEIIRRYHADEEDFSDYNLQDIDFKHTLNNDRENGLWQLTQELSYIIRNIDWSKESADQKS